MAAFIGEYICKIDEKGRITLPTGLRRQFAPEAKDSFVVNRGFEKHLTLYPGNEWSSISKQLNQLNLFVKRNREFLRKFNNGATELELDAAGRILLPKALLNYADISKEVVLFAYANRVELWNRADYQASLETHDDDFADLAEEVMGKINAQSPSSNDQDLS
jgi:MraZ protein